MSPVVFQAAKLSFATPAFYFIFPNLVSFNIMDTLTLQKSQVIFSTEVLPDMGRKF